MDYHSAPARRSRQVRRATVGLATSLAGRRRPKIVRAFWWDGHPNFGDSMTPWLLQRHGYIPWLKPSGEADLVGVGSILEMVGTDFEGAIWGSGLMHERAREFPNARVLAVRGPLTRDLLGVSSTVAVGDPGLLVSSFIPRPLRHARIAVVPHASHALEPSTFDRLLSRYPDQTLHVRPDQPVGRVVSAIASSELVVSSSLHALITADAYGIPAVWAVPDGTNFHVPDFKFGDYHQALNIHRAPFRLTESSPLEDLRRLAARSDADRVKEISRDLQRTLEDALEHKH